MQYPKCRIFYFVIPRIIVVITQSQASESLDFCFNSNLEGFRLNTTVLMNKDVSQWMECVMKCVTEPCCRSVNYKKTSQNEPNCEMLHHVIYNTSDKELERNSSYDYVYLIDPQKEYNASCFVVDDSVKVAQKSCTSLYKSGERNDGLYTIDPDGLGTFQVWCDMQNYGWTVFQRRLNGSVDFYRGWSDYKVGFGDLNGEFWLGLDKIHRLTNSSRKALGIDLMYLDSTTAYAKYGSFSVASELDSYKLNVDDFSGNASDALSYHNEMKFTTKDRDNDEWSVGNCAVRFKGAWWYKRCFESNLNGFTYSWYSLRSLKKSEMKMRPFQF